jgi:anthranilate phosphoribosyltransferase
MVLLNAGAAFYAASKTDTMKEGIALAVKSIDSGSARNKLEALIKKTTAQ